jgi:hypothetical protein
VYGSVGSPVPFAAVRWVRRGSFRRRRRLDGREEPRVARQADRTDPGGVRTAGAGANRSAPPGRFEEDSAPPKSGSGEDLPPGDELTRRILEAEPGSLRAVPAPSQAPRDPVAAGNSPRGTWGRWPTPGVAAGRRTCQISRTWQVRSGRQAGPAPAGAPSATYDVRSNPTASFARSATPGSSRIRMIARQPVAVAALQR